MKKLQLFTDGAARGNPGEAALGVLVKDDTGKVLASRHAYLGHATNNVAEYRGLIVGLRLAQELAPDALEVYMDSKLVVEQVNARWKVNDENLRVLCRQARALMGSFAKVSLRYIPREKNMEADALANLALDSPGRKVDRAALGLDDNLP